MTKQADIILRGDEGPKELMGTCIGWGSTWAHVPLSLPRPYLIQTTRDAHAALADALEAFVGDDTEITWWARPPARMVGGFNMTCSRCARSFSSSQDFHTHVGQGCK